MPPQEEDNAAAGDKVRRVTGVCCNSFQCVHESGCCDALGVGYVEVGGRKQAQRFSRGRRRDAERQRGMGHRATYS